MSDDEQWGPWTEHDGKGCPCIGMLAEVEYADGDVLVLRLGVGWFSTGAEAHYNGPLYRTSWDWSTEGRQVPVVRYRVRKPRALLDLIERARELDDAPEGPVRAPAKRVDA